MDGTIDPRAQSCDATMTLSPIDKLRCPVGDNESCERGSPEHLLPVLNIIRHIYFIISLLRFIIHHIYYGAASPI